MQSDQWRTSYTIAPVNRQSARFVYDDLGGMRDRVLHQAGIIEYQITSRQAHLQCRLIDNLVDI